MAVRTDVRIETSLGDAVATPVRDLVAEDEWLICTPWNDRRFFGTRAEVTKEMRRLIAEAEAE